jgi:hypothetical protein
MSDHNVLFDAKAGLTVAATLVNALSLAEAMQHMNVLRAQMSILVENGLVQPRHRATQSGGQDRYPAADLDAFLVSSASIRHPRTHHVKFRNIPETARECCRSAADASG